MKLEDFIIESTNIVLKPTNLDYAEDIFRSFTPELTIYMQPKAAEKIKETIEYINGSMARNAAGGNLGLVILKKESGEFLGNAGLHHTDTKTPELGIWVKKAAHGHGYGKEAMFALKKWADDNLDYEYILYPVDHRNFASRRIPEALGGKVFREYDSIGQSGNQMHTLEYRIYKNKK